VSGRGAALVPVALALAAGAAGLAGCHREDRLGSAELRRQIDALEQERETLYARLGDMLARDPRLAGMPQTPVRVDVPTALVRTLLDKLAAGFANQVTLVLEDIHVEDHGEVRKMVTLGRYALEVTIESVSGRLQSGSPDVVFGANSVSVALPVRLASGEGRARLHFRWTGAGVAGAACGDLDTVQPVGGRVKPASYLLRGSVRLAVAGGTIVATPRFPPLRVRLQIEPSAESWAAARRVLDSKRSGVCGTVLDHVDVLGLVRRVVDRGFEVRLPTEKVRPVAVPVAVAPTVDMGGGRQVALAISLGGLTVTERALWLGVQVKLVPPSTPTVTPALIAAPLPPLSGRERSSGRRPAPSR